MSDQLQEAKIAQLETENTALKQSIEQLYALNELARQIGAAENLEMLIQKLVRQAIRMIKAEQGVVTLINNDQFTTMDTLFRTRLDNEDQQIFRPPRLMLGWMEKHKKPRRINISKQEDADLLPNWHQTIRSFLCVPLLVKGELIGLLSLFNKNGAVEFSTDDEKMLYIIAMQSAQVIAQQRLIEEQNRVKMIFGQHVSPAMVDEILQAGTEIASRRLPMCVMFMDIRGFSTLAERMQPEEVMTYLNSLFEFMIECVLQHKGIIHRLLGDSFIALFGAPKQQGNDMQNAVNAGLAMLQTLSDKCAAGEIPYTRIGIGIHAGDVVVGTVGTANRKEYQINGDVVNLTARIEQLNKVTNSQMLISDTVWKSINQQKYEAESLGDMEVKGRKEKVHVYKLA